MVPSARHRTPLALRLSRTEERRYRSEVAPLRVSVRYRQSIAGLACAALCGLVPLAGCDTATRIRGVSLLADTLDRVGPYRVISEIDDPDGVGAAYLHYIPGEAQEAILAMTEVSDGLFEGRIPGQPAFTRVRYYVEAVDRGEHVTSPGGAWGGAPLYGFWVLGGRCAAELECGPSESCDASGTCRQRSGPCSTDGDCGKARRCGPLGTCLLAARRCDHDEGCVSGEVCEKRLGECIPRPRCDAALVCPEDFACEAASGLCLRSCLGAGECGPGETCKGGLCSGARACLTDEGCGAGLVCDPLLRYCRPAGAGLCAPCTHDQDCGGPSDYCLLLGAVQACGRSCASEPCPAGYTCKTGLTPPQCAPSSGICSS